MNILIVGSGGREHALAWKCAHSKHADKIFVAPGNAGTALESKCQNITIDMMDFEKLIAFAKENAVGLTIIGPEAPLAAGIVDQFQAAGLACFGPSKEATRLESSKVFSKAFMAQHNIPTARFQCFSEVDKAKAYAHKLGTPLVVKANGLAAGKGVVIAHSFEEAEQAIDDMLTQHLFGEASQSIVIEEFLTGEEASFMAVVDGETIIPLASSQDHKARDDGDVGPNTGGMGAYSPAPVLTEALSDKVIKEVMEPTVKALAAKGTPFTGFLYAGLMISPSQSIKVLEFNTRLGDPETQVLMMRLQSDLVELCLSAVNHTLSEQSVQWDPRFALGVVLAAGGYPMKYHKGYIIQGLEGVNDPAVKTFHAGTATKDEKIVTNGGRVLCVTALADDIEQAQDAAYESVKRISWPDIFYRHDIGHKALKYSQSTAM